MDLGSEGESVIYFNYIEWETGYVVVQSLRKQQVSVD